MVDVFCFYSVLWSQQYLDCAMCSCLLVSSKWVGYACRLCVMFNVVLKFLAISSLFLLLRLIFELVDWFPKVWLPVSMPLCFYNVSLLFDFPSFLIFWFWWWSILCDVLSTFLSFLNTCIICFFKNNNFFLKIQVKPYPS